MDCNKIIKIYNESCNHYCNRFTHYETIMRAEALRLQSDRNCLESMKILEKYCKSENKQK